MAGLFFCLWKLIIAKMHHEQWSRDTDLSGGAHPNQQYLKSFGKSLKLIDVNLQY